MSSVFSANITNEAPLFKKFHFEASYYLQCHLYTWHYLLPNQTCHNFWGCKIIMRSCICSEIWSWVKNILQSWLFEKSYRPQSNGWSLELTHCVLTRSLMCLRKMKKCPSSVCTASTWLMPENISRCNHVTTAEVAISGNELNDCPWLTDLIGTLNSSISSFVYTNDETGNA